MEGLFIKELNGKKGVFTKDGEQIIPYEWQNIWLRKKGIIVQNENDFKGVYSRNGELILPCIWRYVNIFSECIITCLRKKYAIFSLTGDEILKWGWKKIFCFHEGFKVQSRETELWGFYSYEGKAILKCEWSFVNKGDFYIEAMNNIGELHKFSFTGEEIN
jgi:hypothetical protein